MQTYETMITTVATFGKESIEHKGYLFLHVSALEYSNLTGFNISAKFYPPMHVSDNELSQLKL